MINAPTKRCRSRSLSLSLSNSQTQSQETLKAFEANKHKLFENFRAELESGLPKESTQKSKKSYKQPSLFPLDEDKGLNNAGDFRSKDCIELLKLADIVVTNPPFSLFREYVAQLVEYDKKFLMIAPLNAITYKEVFKLIKENKLWLGYGFRAGNAYFKIKKEAGKNFANGVYDEKTGLVKFRNVTWVTNLTHKKRNEILETIASYKKNPEQYPKYDNYDAINVDKTIEIPLDYDGIMGVPITFLDKHNPKQFEIVDGIGRYSMLTGPTPETQGTYLTMIKGKPKYARIIIRKIAEVAELRKLEFEKM
ncbi:adenosine deaminase [Campylobacter upsaliensis]|nr:adenosine deaminase [Campylobacter upsaliensis]